MSAHEAARASVEAAGAYRNAGEHLWDELAKLDLLILRRVQRFRHELSGREPQPGDPAPDPQQPYISHAEIDRLLHAGAAAPDTSELDRVIQALDLRIEQRAEAAVECGLVLPLVHLAQIFDLSEFEYQVLVICLGPELRRKYDRLYAYLQDDISCKRPSRELVLDLLCDNESERWEMRHSLAPASVLFNACLIKTSEDPHSPFGSSDLATLLALEPALVEFVLGHPAVDPRLRGMARLGISRLPPQRLIADTPLKQVVSRRLQQGLNEAGGDTPHRILHLSGPPAVGKRTLAASLCAKQGAGILELDLPRLLESGADAAYLSTLALRDSLCLRAPLLLDSAECLDDPASAAPGLMAGLTDRMSRLGGVSFVCSSKPLQNTALFRGLDFNSYAMTGPDHMQREQAWRMYLDEPMGQASGPAAALLARQFTLTVGRIEEAFQRTLADCLDQQQPLSPARLAAACRDQSDRRLASLAAKIDPVYDWNDIVLPQSQRDQMEAVCAQVRHRHQVLEDWGFRAKLPYGNGLSALFTGAPGTGKTMAAQVIARDLGLDLYKIDLAGVVSKYIGETEKNLARIFHEAEAGNGVLLFDECDALFGKRTEVTDAHDRYANIEVSFLLQRIEEYEGIVILSTNLKKNMDEAFIRRLRFVIEFPFPDPRSRENIWKGLLPKQAPRAEDIDFGFLAARIPLAGGNIKNIVLNAAYLAAQAQCAIDMQHLIEGTRREFEKIGKLWDAEKFRLEATHKTTHPPRACGGGHE